MPNLSQQRQHPALIALGEAIRLARKKQGISQEKLALMAGIDRSYIGRVERGDNNVAILTLLKIAPALNVGLKDLMKEARPRNLNPGIAIPAPTNNQCAKLFR